MAADCSFFLSVTAFTTVCTLYCSADGSRLLILALVNVFHDGFRALFLSGWQRIAPSFSRQQLSRRFAYRIVPQMVADCSYFRSSKAFTTDCAPYCTADGSALVILLLVHSFSDGLRAVLLCRWQCVAHTSARQRLSRQIVRCIAHLMAAYCSFFCSSMAFPTVYAPYCSADNSGLHIHPLVKAFHDGLRAVLLN